VGRRRRAVEGVVSLPSGPVETERFTFQPTTLAGVWEVRRKPRGDARGWFLRLYCAEELRDAGVLEDPLVQINQSCTSRRGAVRGLHYQRAPHAETKVVTCIEGSAWDVAVDLRAGSPTFGAHHALTLRADEHTSLLIPPGVAHGFQTLTESCQLLYLHTAAYQPDAEGGVHVEDPALALPWPEEITEMSGRDRALPRLDPGFPGLTV
jgi:dTDP-4-dehydrorhamnose 3,5-epimerase